MNIEKSRKVLIFRVFCIIILGILFIRGCALPWIQFGREKDLDLTEKELQVKNEKYQNEYLSFLKKDVAKKIEVIDNFSSKTKSNYLVVSYEDTHVFFHRINLNKKVSINKFIKLEKRSLGESPDVIYAGSDSFLYSSQSFPLVNNLIITFDGNLVNYVKENDSLININYLANRSSFRYETNGITDMVFKSSNEDEPISMNVVLLNKNSYVLIIIGTSLRSGVNLKQSFIREMLDL